MNNNRFVFVAPVYNAENTVGKMLASIFHQSYENWRIILVDDVSTDETVNAIAAATYGYSHSQRPSNGTTANYWRMVHTGQVETIKNAEKRWEVANVLEGIKRCEDDDIICRIDGDDFLCDLDALRILNEVYNQTKADFVWSKHRWVDSKRITDFNISAPLTPGVDVYKHPWVTSHLKTFRKHLINDVNDENFRGKDGEYIRRAGDQAVILPVLHQAKNPIFLPMVLYSYHCNMDPQTFQTPDAVFQKEEAEYLRQRGYVK